ncbi:MAG TPA: bifunctional serine/threonine protein kinase/MFS transporter [Ktedonosporobacter sp.]|nr:bifunctional serine/threonine protein kinase/MFS transporter [Ktedonosporobacter sp.]
MGGVIISQRSGPNTQTGQLDRRTLLHKRYVIQRIIGQGGMGAVYMAKDIKRHGTICAVKEMSLSMIPPNEQTQAIENFKIEAKILWGLNHPNLPAFTGFFSENQRYFMVMEYIDGSTLEDLLDRNQAPFTERRVLGWARQLCDVLEYLHSQNPPIIFRDMKPGNVMLTRTGHIKLIDFGIARFFRPTGYHDTQLLGTPGFAPPEQYGKSQTDERSDIYSLAMTLFQLLTNTLSESGFGLRDVRSINPQISPVVARALEKATALQSEDRYQSVAEFRSALLGVGTFVFENGDLATTVMELADLCIRYPEEASDYLSAGEIELWLQEIGEVKLAREAQRIRVTVSDPQESIEQFLQVILGQRYPLPNQVANNGAATKRSHVSWPAQKAASPVQVSPSSFDFGSVYPGISGPQMLTITGDQGMLVSGTVYSNEPWIMLDQAQFDGTVTRLNVRINSTQLPGSTHYSGTVIVSPYSDDNPNAQNDLMVSVEVDVLGYTSQSWQRRGGKTVGADLDDEEDEEEYEVLTMGMTTNARLQGAMIQTLPPKAQATSPAPPQKGQQPTQKAPSLAPVPDPRAEYEKKYGLPAPKGASSSGWDPMQATTRELLWRQRGLTFAAAFMAGSVCYTLLSQLPLHTSPLPPDSWFIILLTGMVPTATLGALLINRHKTWGRREMLNYLCTGMGVTLLSLALVKFGWQLVRIPALPPWQLIIMLLVAAAGATVGTTPIIGDYIIYGTSWALAQMRRVAMFGAGILGGLLGYLLTLGPPLSLFTPFGVLAGIGVAVALAWQVDRLMQQQQNQP